MHTTSTQCRLRICSECSRDTEFFCISCKCDLCNQCKKNHADDLKTAAHNVVEYREKFDYIPKLEICARHPNIFYKMYCDSCQTPMCDSCSKHKSQIFPFTLYKQYAHNIVGMKEAYRKRQGEYKEFFQIIQNGALLYKAVQTGMKAEFKTCQNNDVFFQSHKLKKAKLLKCHIDKVLCNFDFNHMCLKQQTEKLKNSLRLERFEELFEFSAFRPVRFLLDVKQTNVVPIEGDNRCLTIHTSLNLTGSINKKVVEDIFNEFQIERRGGYERFLKRLSDPKIYKSLTVIGVRGCYNFSRVALDRFWVNDRKNLILTNMDGVTFHRLMDFCSDLYIKSHTVNSHSELIYINKRYKIMKLSKDLKTSTLFIKGAGSTVRPRCLYSSPQNGDLLVGMYIEKSRTGKVFRYSQTGQLKDTMQQGNTGNQLFRDPRYIAENNNGDIAVSDSENVIVTDRGGIHRFSYTGHPLGSILMPRGICTDALSHILVCDQITDTVQMIDRDGNFLSFLLTRPPGILTPLSLSYDVCTHHLWVGSQYNNFVGVYKYITQRHNEIDKQATAERIELLGKDLITDTGNPQEINNCLLKLMSRLDLDRSLIVKDVCGSYHISRVTSDVVWVSDDKNNLILTNTTCDTIYHLNDLCSDLRSGLHTVNKEGELFYIDRDYTVRKVSKDLETTTACILITDSTWKLRCVYWSPNSEDLLVGMNLHNGNKNKGKLARYGRTSQLTQTIEYSKTGIELYSSPDYITENKNGDVVVSDSYQNAVVVTDSRGHERFYYTGHSSQSVIWPRGICTDALSHILVCDENNETIHIIDKDGQFLLSFLMGPSGLTIPLGLSYDFDTHRLWVGSNKDIVCIYSYMTDEDAFSDTHNSLEDYAWSRPTLV